MPAKKSSAGSIGANGKAQKTADAVKMLHKQNESIRSKAAKLEIDFKAGSKDALALHELLEMWSAQAALKDDIVYPAFAEAGVSGEAIAKAQIESDLVAVIFRDLTFRELNDPMFGTVLTVLESALQRFFEIEEDERDGLFAEAKKAEMDLMKLGKAVQSRALRAGQQAEDTATIPSPRYLRGVGSTISMEHDSMRARERPRDEQGRFVDDDRRHRNYDDDDRRYARRHDDDDDNRGWYGDRGGHAAAARKGWETRRGDRYDDDDDRRSYRGRSDYDDDRRSYRNRDDDDDDRRMSRGRRTGGWFGDREGHSEASRRGWDNPDHGSSGWYGDREGHSRASQRGWDNPDHGPSGWYGDREGHSRAARRGWDSPNHGPSGWYGDPEGHSEASRRGWDDRRHESDYDYDRRRSRRRSYD